MRLHVVSDVHGNAAALARAADGADGLVVLGDLLEAVDYTDPRRGVMGELYGPDVTARWIELRSAQRFDEARSHSRAALADAARAADRDPQDLLADAITAAYAPVFAALPTPAWGTWGNVDAPHLWPEVPGFTVLDGATAEIGGHRFGFVAGALADRSSSYPYLRTEDELAAAVAALGPVDVLCSHVPPALPELCYDVVPARFERGSTALLEYVREHQPRWSLFGHVHQPLQQRRRVGRTECVNVGHFRVTQTPWVLDLAGR